MQEQSPTKHIIFFYFKQHLPKMAFGDAYVCQTKLFYY